MKHGIVSLLIVFAATTKNAYAEETKGPPESKKTEETQFKPREGEQLDYKKKYYPTETSHDLFMEVNPLLLVKRGIGFEFEMRGGERWTFGTDILYTSAKVYDKNGTTGRTEYLGLGPKIRFYPIHALSGVFFGFKALLGNVQSTITQDGVEDEYSKTQISPTVHAGYRFASFSGFTVAAYLGGGLNFPQAKIANKPERNQDWRSARDEINKEHGVFRPDFGLTVGVAL